MRRVANDEARRAEHGLHPEDRPAVLDRWVEHPDGMGMRPGRCAELRARHGQASQAHMRLRAAVAGVMGCVLGTAGVALADARTEAVARLQARYEATRSMRASFRQRVESPTLAAPLESRGTVLFERPNRMRWDYAPPDEQLIVGDGQTLWVYQPDLKQVIRAPLRDAFQAQTPLTFLAGLGRVERDFDTTLEREDAERWVLRLVPKGDAELGTLVLVVRKADAGLAEARIIDPLGTTTSLAFTDEARNVEIAADRFRFEPPPGVDVVSPPAY